MNDSLPKSGIPPILPIQKPNEDFPMPQIPPTSSFELPDMNKEVMTSSMPSMEKMITPKLYPGMPDGYYTPETIRPYIQNPIVYDTMRYYEGLKHRPDGNTQTSPPPRRLQSQC